jgi:hypothetical protein
MTSSITAAILTATSENPYEIPQDRYERIREEHPEIHKIIKKNVAAHTVIIIPAPIQLTAQRHTSTA